jgi:hypothetical protein
MLSSQSISTCNIRSPISNDLLRRCAFAQQSLAVNRILQNLIWWCSSITYGSVYFLPTLEARSCCRTWRPERRFRDWRHDSHRHRTIRGFVRSSSLSSRHWRYRRHSPLLKSSAMYGSWRSTWRMLPILTFPTLTLCC